MLYKHRLHIKDPWYIIKLTNLKRGQWSQDEYQSLFHLVNMDLGMRASKERNSGIAYSWIIIVEVQLVRGCPLEEMIHTA